MHLVAMNPNSIITCTLHHSPHIHDDTLVQLTLEASCHCTCRVHSADYVESISAMSKDYSKGIHRTGDETCFAPGCFDIAALAAGGAITATDQVMSGEKEMHDAKVLICCSVSTVYQS